MVSKVAAGGVMYADSVIAIGHTRLSIDYVRSSDMSYDIISPPKNNIEALTDLCEIGRHHMRIYLPFCMMPSATRTCIRR
jgi:hypothetical protein